MINFDIKTIKILNNPEKKIQDKLFLFARFIEEKYHFENQPDY
jgi:hypothetical protein